MCSHPDDFSCHQRSWAELENIPLIGLALPKKAYENT